MLSGLHFALLVCLAGGLLPAGVNAEYEEYGWPKESYPGPGYHPKGYPQKGYPSYGSSYYYPQNDKRSCCPARCPSGWFELGYYCYSYYDKPKSWHDAEYHCLSFGANLASIHKEYDSNYLKNYMYKVSGSKKPTWIGGHDAVTEGKWMWSDGTKFKYGGWGPSKKPDPLRNCLHMNHADYGWKDEMCNMTLPYLCSKYRRYEDYYYYY